MYTKKVLKHFRNPKNLGKIENADGIGKVGNLRCGDVMHLYIKVEKNEKGEEIIKDIKFETFGCTAAIATSSVITEMAKGKTLKQVLDLRKEEVVKDLGGLPPVKMHCSVLAVDALKEAMYNYLKKNEKEIPQKLKKRHSRIRKTEKELEKRYGDLMEAEEKMIKENHE